MKTQSIEPGIINYIETTRDVKPQTRYRPEANQALRLDRVARTIIFTHSAKIPVLVIFYVLLVLVLDRYYREVHASDVV